MKPNEAIDKTGMYRVDGFLVHVKVLDYKSIYKDGFKRVLFKITPVSGEGVVWVKSDMVTLI